MKFLWKPQITLCLTRKGIQIFESAWNPKSADTNRQQDVSVADRWGHTEAVMKCLSASRLQEHRTEGKGNVDCHTDGGTGHESMMMMMGWWDNDDDNEVRKTMKASVTVYCFWTEIWNLALKNNDCVSLGLHCDFRWLAGWLVGSFVCLLVSLFVVYLVVGLVTCLVFLVDCLLAYLVVGLFGCLEGSLFVCFVSQSLDWLVGYLVSWLVG